ncbi:MAG: hypothetical protein V1764_00515 [Nitrospirota bacterium]
MKLSSVVSDTFGVSGGKMIEAIMEGRLSAAEISGLAEVRLKGKKEEHGEALAGNYQDHHRFMIRASLEHVRQMERIIVDLDQEIDRKLKDHHQEYE